MIHRRLIAIALLILLAGGLAGCASSAPLPPGPEGLYQQHCSRCHARAGQPGGPQIGGSKGPDLTHIGSATGMTADWLSEYIRNPKSKRPNAKLMPAFGDQMTEDEIRSLAEWLAAKK